MPVYISHTHRMCHFDQSIRDVREEAALGVSGPGPRSPGPAPRRPLPADLSAHCGFPTFYGRLGHGARAVLRAASRRVNSTVVGTRPQVGPRRPTTSLVRVTHTTGTCLHTLGWTLVQSTTCPVRWGSEVPHRGRGFPLTDLTALTYSVSVKGGKQQQGVGPRQTHSTNQLTYHG